MTGVAADAAMSLLVERVATSNEPLFVANAMNLMRKLKVPEAALPATYDDPTKTVKIIAPVPAEGRPALSHRRGNGERADLQ